MTDTGRLLGDVVNLLTTLIRFDTTNWGHGKSTGERPAAEWVAERLRSVGWQPVVLARPDAPDRANVVLRVPGTDPGQPAVLVHAHLDVVPAEPDQWSVDPFAGLVRDGYVYGRGAVDMKDMCASTLATLMSWGRSGTRPRRDVVIAFVADEEDKGDFGAEWLVAEHPQLFGGVAVAIGESGATFRRLERGERAVRCYPIAAAERGTMHLRLTAHGTSGHGSRPAASTSVSLLVDALHRVAHHDWPVHLSPAVRAHLVGVSSALGLTVDLDHHDGVLRCLDELGDLADVSRFTVRASTTPTMINAGYKVNVIPGIATAEVDVRCPPGYDDELLATLPDLIGSSVDYEFSSLSRPVSADVDGPWFAALRAAVLAHDPDALVVPYCMGGGTDAKAFAKLGIECFGFAPLGEDPEGRVLAGVHGIDERVPIASLEWGAKVLYDFLTCV